MAQIVTCPACTKGLQVPDDLLGRTVRCPNCQQTFTAEAKGSVQSSPPALPPARSSRRDDDEDEPRPTRRSSRRDDDDDDYDDRPSRRVRRFRSSLEPHRGSLVLTLGILSLFLFPIVLGPIAWILGSSDLRAMREGRMDPEGEGSTQAGRICGMIGTILGIMILVFMCLYFVFIFGILGLFIAGAAAQKQQMQQKRF